jgi:hypothetical protein
MQAPSQKQQVDSEMTEVISNIYRFTECLNTNFSNFKENIVDFYYERETPPKVISDIYSNLRIAKEKIESVHGYCKNYLSIDLNLTRNELPLLLYALDDRIDAGIKANNFLSTDKIDLKPLYDLKNKLLERYDEYYSETTELSF